jgi:hypothetical protein
MPPWWSKSRRHTDPEWTDEKAVPMSAVSKLQRPPITSSESSRAKQHSLSTTAVAAVQSDLPPPVQSTSQNSRGKKKVQFGSPWSRIWYELQKVVGPGSAPSSIGDSPSSLVSSQMQFDEQRKSVGEPNDTEDMVRNVVVDRFWTGSTPPEESSATTTDDATPEMSGTSPAKRRVWDDSDVANANWWRRTWFVIRWQMWASTLDFFFPKGYSSKEDEDHYQQVSFTITTSLSQHTNRPHRRTGLSASRSPFSRHYGSLPIGSSALVSSPNPCS